MHPATFRYFYYMIKKRLLSFIELHRKSSVYGIYKAFPEFKESEIDEVIKELEEEGWLRRNETQMIDGDKRNLPCVIRSNKKLYEQQELFGGTDGSVSR